MNQCKILITEDDTVLAEGVKINLELSGFSVLIAHNIEEAKGYLTADTQTGQFSLLILDVNLPDGDGIRFAREIRASLSIPIIFLTAKDMDEDMIAGFQAGADDYITKPFNVQVLLQRVHAVLRRYQTAEDEAKSMKVGNLVIDFESYTVEKNGKMISLTPTEFKLLVKLCQNPGTVLTRQVLLEELWDKDENYVDEHTLTIFVSRLRGKISDEEFTYIKTVYGTGYRWIGAEKG
ncbi:MAG: response regulator transcription factor [Faecalicatena sp.]|uniref:response regulator transcription factor n=1 Tax=Faecalicatena sp. TaxID=2005360 RepID=UPI002584FF8D|nr:response regulator transcription factor [Faecalicatena sp.]MCI6467565.1 response regulator transcription factor [Faecalicatena sp.]MDY5619742.1 response regulator transcription factor [Lachnospiraceae bacterium]